MEALVFVGALLLVSIGYALVRRISPGGAPDFFELLHEDVTLGEPYPEGPDSPEERVEH